MVGLDGLARDVHALDTVGVDRALRQPFDIVNLGGLLVEDLDEVRADDLALLLRICHAGQVGEETRGGVHASDVQAQVVVEIQHVLEFIQPQQAMVDEDAVQALANSPVQQHGCDRRIHAAAQSQHDLILSQLSLQLGDGRLDEGGVGPFAAAAADPHHEILQQLAAGEGVLDLRVELDAPDA